MKAIWCALTITTAIGCERGGSDTRPTGAEATPKPTHAAASRPHPSLEPRLVDGPTNATSRSGANPSTTSVTSSASSPNVEVSIYGQLHRMMHQHDTGPVIDLADVLNPRVYALGALSELRGEVTVLAGTVWTAYPEGDAARVESSKTSTERAALLVTASVAEWRSVPIDAEVSWAALDETVEKLAKAAGVDVERPFPFLINGVFAQLEWHVIDGTKLADGPSNHAAHQRAAVRDSGKNVQATALGFFSKHHQGVFTHHDSNVHAHVVIPEKRATGHVDMAAIAAGAVLELPR